MTPEGEMIRITSSSPICRYGPLLGRDLDWSTEIAVGVGSSETLFACMQALVNPGDEVLMLSPAFDIYA